MKQRVAIARTLAYDPQILLLDEPLGALDAQTREVMQDELLRIWDSTKKTVVMVTHDVNEAVYLAQRVLVMSRRPGRMVEEFRVQVDRRQGREAVMLSDEFNGIRNKVWLAVRRQAVECRAMSTACAALGLDRGAARGLGDRGPDPGRRSGLPARRSHDRCRAVGPADRRRDLDQSPRVDLSGARRSRDRDGGRRGGRVADGDLPRGERLLRPAGRDDLLPAQGVARAAVHSLVRHRRHHQHADRVPRDAAAGRRQHVSRRQGGAASARVERAGDGHAARADPAAHPDPRVAAEHPDRACASRSAFRGC